MPVPLPPTPPWDTAGRATDPSLPGVPLAGAEELAVVTRSGFIESRHVGHAVVVGPDGQLVVEMGAPDATINPRSSLKLIQAAACVAAGADLADAALAVGAGSHLGHPDHVDLVARMLDRVGLGLDALQTPPALPAEEWARDDVVRAGGSPDPVHHNCSGKHAAMLSTCVAAGWDPATYRDVEHPLQRRIRALVEQVTGVEVAHVGVDGCGAPLFTTTPSGLAVAFARAGRSAAGDSDDVLGDVLGRVGAAMRAHPWAVAGIGADDTVIMQELEGVIAKGGAEGVMALGTADGFGVVVKVLDGNNRAAVPAALALLAATGVDATAVADAIATRTLGHGIPVGRVHASDLVHERAANGPEATSAIEAKM